MKKLLLSLSMAALLPAMASADSFDVTFKTGEWPNVTAYSSTSESNAEFGGSKWFLTNFPNNNGGWEYIKGGGKTTTNGISSIVNRTALSQKIEKVSATIDNLQYGTVNAVTLLVADDNKFADATTYTFSGDRTKTGVWEIPVTVPAANKFYKVEFDITNPNMTKNGVVSISKFTFSYTAEEGVVDAPAMTPVPGWIESGKTVELSAAEGTSIYYTLNNEEPTVSSTLYDGTPITVDADMTIKAIAVKDGKASAVKEAAYTVYPANTAENPLTSGRTLELIGKGFPETVDVFVGGVISDITEVDTGSYGNATYTITDEDAANPLLIFRGYYLDNAKFTSADQIAVGDKVVVTGKLKNYNGTAEMDARNYIVSIEKQTTPVVKCDTPVFSRESGSELSAGDVVTISTTTEGAVIVYTIGDTETTSESNSVDVTIDESCTITAKAVKEGFDDSDEVSASYTVAQLDENEFEYTFDFTGDEAYGMDLHSTSNGSGTYNPEVYICDGGNVTLTLNGKNRWWSATKGNELRFHADSSFEVTGKGEETMIKKIELVAAVNSDWVADADDAGYDAGVWTGSANSVKLNNTKTSGNTAVKGIKVLYEIPAAVETIDADLASSVRYFNLQGVEVSAPANGLYIRVQGKKADKVML